jgi:hypothetical protein
MRVHIGPYKKWFGPYQLAEVLMFWVPKQKDENGFPQTAERVHRFGEWLAYGSIAPKPKVGDVYDIFRTDRKVTLLYRFLGWIDSKKSRKMSVRIDSWDTWGMDDTLGYIIRPMLYQLKKKKQGAPQVDFDDVPEYLRPTAEELEKYNSDGTTDDKFFERWDWVLDQMIFAFDSLDGGPNEDWEHQFTTGEYDFRLKKQDDDTSLMVRGENHTAETDWDARKAYGERIQNGFRLFGKYYQSLWC